MWHRPAPVMLAALVMCWEGSAKSFSVLWPSCLLAMFCRDVLALSFVKAGTGHSKHE